MKSELEQHLSRQVEKLLDHVIEDSQTVGRLEGERRLGNRTPANETIEHTLHRGIAEKRQLLLRHIRYLEGNGSCPASPSVTPRVPAGWRLSTSKYGITVAGPNNEFTEVQRGGHFLGDDVVFGLLDAMLAASVESAEPDALEKALGLDPVDDDWVQRHIDCSVSEFIDMPANLRRPSNMELHGQKVIDDLRAEVKTLKAKREATKADALEEWATEIEHAIGTESTDKFLERVAGYARTYAAYLRERSSR